MFIKKDIVPFIEASITKEFDFEINLQFSEKYQKFEIYGNGKKCQISNVTFLFTHRKSIIESIIKKAEKYLT